MKAAITLVLLLLPVLAEARGGVCNSGSLCEITGTVVFVALALGWLITFGATAKKQGFLKAISSSNVIRVVAGYLLFIVGPLLVAMLLYRANPILGYVAFAAIGIGALLVNARTSKSRPQQGVQPDGPASSGSAG